MFMGAVLMFGACLCACSGSSSPTSEGTSTSSTVPETIATTTTSVLSLTERVQQSWQGIQLDVIGNRPIPGATSLFFQRGNWAGLALMTTSTTWCLENEYRWRVTSATSPTHFVVQYDRIRSHPGCTAATDDTKLVVNVNGSRQMGGRTVYDIRYTVPPLDAPTTRTVCATTWNSTDRCGYTTTGVRLPASPSA
jgi:hypothetical protein